MEVGIKIIGSEEWCVFENLGIPAIKARVDSGAKTSSIQATNLKIISKKKEVNGQDIRCFLVNGKVLASMQRQTQK